MCEMCYCDTHFFTIGKDDSIMVGRRPKLDHGLEMFETLPDPELIYVIDPETLITMIEELIASGMIKGYRYGGGFMQVGTLDVD